MAYDTTDQPQTQAVVNLMRLAERLRGLEKFNMCYEGNLEDADIGYCGSPACIGGEARAMLRVRKDIDDIGMENLGLTATQTRALMFPSEGEWPDAITCRDPLRAARVLDHLISTGLAAGDIQKGVVDWGIR